LDDENDLYNEKLLDNKIKEVKNNQYDMSLLDYSYWETLIKQ
jgi:endo-alpha-1,4-polygalactosaminidase (GH114 family)